MVLGCPGQQWARRVGKAAAEGGSEPHSAFHLRVDQMEENTLGAVSGYSTRPPLWLFNDYGPPKPGVNSVVTPHMLASNVRLNDVAVRDFRPELPL